MARRHSAASRSSSSGRRRSGAAGARAGGPRARRDGKVDVSCPQCGAAYRVGEDMLDAKIECTECHRVFFAKTTAGKRVKAPDHTRVYVAFGVAAVAIIGLFAIMSGNRGGEPAREDRQAAAPKEPAFTTGTHPRADQLVKWAQSIASNNQLVLATHSDLPALARQLGVDGADAPTVIRALQEHESTRYLRTMQCDSAALSGEADMTAATGSGVIFVTPKAGDDDYKRNTRGEIAVTFRTDGEQIKVSGFEVRLHPVWNPAKPRPGTVTFKPNEEIARPDVVEISDSAGTRKVTESEPTPLPHWDGATPELRTLADQVVADILRFASDPAAPGGLFNQATLRVQSDDQKKAAVPRALNAMYECYGDVIGKHEQLKLLDRALYQWTGYAVNYPPESSGDPAKDTERRRSCVRQWFAFWWRYHENLDEFFEKGDVLADDPDKDKKG